MRTTKCEMNIWKRETFLRPTFHFSSKLEVQNEEARYLLLYHCYYEQKQLSSLQEDVKSICKKIKKIQSCDTILQYTMHAHSYPKGKAISLLIVKVRNTYSEQKKVASSFQYLRATHCNSQRHALRRNQMIYSMEIRKVFFFIGAMYSQLCRTLRNFFKRIGGGMVVDFSKIIL